MQDFCLLFFFLSFLPSFLSLPPTPKFSKGLDSLNWEDPSSSSSWMTECMSLGKLLNFFGLPLQFSSVQLSYSGVSDSATLQTAAHQVSLPITSSWSLLKLMSIKSVIPSKHLILCHTLLFPPSIIPSIKVFSTELVLRIKWPEYWSFSFSISPSSEYSLKSSSTPQFKDIHSSVV